MSPTKRKRVRRAYTWRPDLPDHRDHALRASFPISSSVPKLACLPPVKDQGELGSCTAHAGTTCIEASEIKAQAADALAKSVNPCPISPLSRLMYYWLERRIEGTVRKDSGAEIRDGVKAAHRSGVCVEKLWPYKPARFRMTPDARAIRDASKRRISEYLRLVTPQDMMSCLSEGFPFMFGFTVYEGFESDEVAKTGIVQLPEADENSLGGHAVVAVGYDSSDLATGRVLVMNSWGPKWGQDGFFTMPWAYLTNRDLSDDFWTIRK